LRNLAKGILDNLFQPHVTSDPKVGVVLPTTCASLLQNRFNRFSKLRVHKFGNRQTDKQTNKQTDKGHNRTNERTHYQSGLVLVKA